MAVTSSSVVRKIIAAGAVLYLFSPTYFIHAKQPPYAFIHEYARVMSVDPKLANITIQFFKFNRTSAVMNLTWVCLSEQDNFTLHAEGYQFLSNEFRKSVIDLSLPFCDFMSGKRTDFDAVNILHTCGEIKTCPLHKGDVIRLCNISPQPSQFPPFIPRGRWSIRLTILANNTIPVATIEWIVQIVDFNQV